PDRGIEGAAAQDPVVDPLTRRLAFLGPVARALVRANGRADHLDSLGMSAGDELLVAGDHLLDGDLRLAEREPAGAAAAGRAQRPEALADVVHPLEYDDVFDVGQAQHVLVEPGERGLAHARAEHAV